MLQTISSEISVEVRRIKPVSNSFLHIDGRGVAEHNSALVLGVIWMQDIQIHPVACLHLNSSLIVVLLTKAPTMQK